MEDGKVVCVSIAVSMFHPMHAIRPGMERNSLSLALYYDYGR